MTATDQNQASLYYRRKNSRVRRGAQAPLFRTHVFTTANTDIDTAAVFGDAASMQRPITFSFSLSRSAVGAGLVLAFGGATRGLAVWIDGDDVNVAAGAGTGTADDGVTLNAADSLLLTVARATLTITANPANAETVTINGRIYTFQTSLTNVDGNVKIGATASDTLDNLIAAINHAAGGGTTYAAATVIHATVTASAGAGDTMIATAKTSGVGGNSIAVSEGLANGTWDSTRLLGGLDAIRFVLSVDPGAGRVGLYRNGSLLKSAVSVNGNFGGEWADTGHGAIGNTAGAASDRVPGGSQIALANVGIVGPVSVFLHQRAGA